MADTLETGFRRFYDIRSEIVVAIVSGRSNLNSLVQIPPQWRDREPKWT